MKTSPLSSTYAPIANQIEAAGIGRAVAVAEALSDLIVRGVNAVKRELDTPARPAWIIVAERSKRSGEQYMRFAPR